MKVANIKNYVGGWMIGNFEPSLFKTGDFEVAHHFYERGYSGTSHTHKVATEYNYVMTGELIASGQTLTTGDIFVYEPGDISDVVFLKDTNLIIIKTPSIPLDKYEGV